MKVLNIVLSILILILAIASAVFAYLLFDKRQQMVEGYESLGKGIADTARYLDKDSGTQTKLNIDHRSESLDQEIRKLSQLAKQVSEERNALAQALVEISAQAGGNATLESLTELAGYESGAASVIASVNNLRANRDMLAEGYLQAAGKFDLSLDYNELVGLDRSGWENSIRAFNVDLDNVKKYKATAETYQSVDVTQEDVAANAYQITFVGENGQAITKRFSRVDYSKRGKLLYNQVTDALVSMGQSISEQEKRQIIMDILKELC